MKACKMMDKILWKISIVLRSGQVITIVCNDDEKNRLHYAASNGIKDIFHIDSHDGGCALVDGKDIAAITFASVDDVL